MTIFGVLGLAASGYAAWQFSTPTQDEVGITVGIETYQSIGLIEVNPIGGYNLDDDPHPLVFAARYLEDGSWISLDQLVLTHEVVLNEALSELISFNSVRTGVWVSDEPISITPTWNENKNPTNMFEYNAIKDNLANYKMTVILNAEVIK